MGEEYQTRIQRKIKEHNFQQTPEYETEFAFPTNLIDDALLLEAFEKIDRLMEESNEILATVANKNTDVYDFEKMLADPTN